MKNDMEEIVIEEFKRSMETSKKSNEKRYGRKEYEKYLIPGLFGIGFLAAVLVGIFLLDLSVVFVCVVLVLEALIGICLHDTPVWVHGMEVVISIVLGLLFHQTVFMIIGALIYLASIFALHFMSKQKG